MQDPREYSVAAWIRVLLAGVAATAVLMVPTFAPLRDGLLGYYNDDWANGVYLHHQVHDALMAGRFDFSDPSQFFPFGYNPVHSNGGNILEMVVSGVFRLFAPWRCAGSRAIVVCRRPRPITLTVHTITVLL